MIKQTFLSILLLGYLHGIAQKETQSYAQKEVDFYSSGQWGNYGNDPGGIRYSPLNQINTANIKSLKSAWSYQTGELLTYEGTEVASKAAFEATPIMIDGVLYFSTPTNRIIAITADTGEELWTFNTRVDLKANYSEITSRGVSKWIDPELNPEDPNYMRILAATIDGRLIALDANTGKPIASFGENGTNN